MKEGAITYEEVVRTAIRILREGKSISKPLVRERMGNRGSHSTIQKHLDSWRETLSESDLEVLPPSMPAELTPHLEAFWEAATSLVETSLSGEWERAKTAIKAAENEKATAIDDRDQWKQYAEDKEADIGRKNTEIEGQTRELARVEERLRVRDLEYQGLQDRLDEKDRAIAGERQAMDERIGMLTTKHQQDSEAAQARWGIERQRLKEEAEAAKARADLEIRRSDQHEIYFLGEVRKARDETELTRERGEQNVKRLEQELTITRRREESGSVRLGKMEERLYACQDEREKLVEDVGAARETLTERDTEVASLRESLVVQESAAELQKATIDDLVKELDSVQPDS